MRPGGRIVVVFAGIFVVCQVDPEVVLEGNGAGEPVVWSGSRARVRRCSAVVRRVLTADVWPRRGVVGRRVVELIGVRVARCVRIVGITRPQLGTLGHGVDRFGEDLDARGVQLCRKRCIDPTW
jgi:hypothetical protein